MRQRLVIEGIKTPVITESYASIVGAVGIEMAKNVLVLGGLYAILLSQESKDALSEEDREIGEKPYIFVLKEVADKITEDELKACLLHEEGHVINGDLENNKNGGLVMDNEAELRADTYAASIVGKAMVKQGLTAALRAQADLLVELAGSSLTTDEILNHTLGNAGTVARMNALSLD